ncbi:MAG: non-canonical purine NTP diphosphatase [Bacteroidota bacterium]|nr:non-canonical purine NTP diphosphatase [Bacteroidota bacterium]
MKLIFASNNQHKIQEIQKMIPANYQILSLKDIGCTENIPETADTIEGNAVLKAQYIHQKYGVNCFADDSGLEVQVLNNAPGVNSARYAGEDKNDQHNMQKLLQDLENQSDRKARFKTVICLIFNNQQYLFEGVINGVITTELRGGNGFGYDPIFAPNGSDKTFAEMSNTEKNNISHRAKAVEQLIKFIESRVE